MFDNFIFSLVSDFIGYVSSKDKTNVAPGVLVRGSQNVYKKLSGTIASRFGLKRRGTADATLAGVLSSYEWYTSLGAVIPMRVANAKLQVEYNLVWYTLLSSLTKTRYVFDPYWDNTNKKDLLLMVKGDSDLQHWSGGIAIIGSSTINTITKSDTTKTWAQEGFDATGSILINGNTYTYSGGAGTNTLTGVSPDPTGEATLSVALQTVVTSSNTPASGYNNDFIKVIGNQVFVGSYTSRAVYVSGDGNGSNGTYTNYTVPSPTLAGSPEYLTLDNAPVGIGVKDGNANIFAGTSDRYVVSFTLVSFGTAAAPITIRQTKVDKRIMPALFAPLAHEFIDNVGNDIVLLSQDHQLRIVGTFKDIFNNDRYPSLSQSIQDELKDVSFTGGHLRSIGEFIYITSPSTGIHYMHQTRENVEPNGLVTAERLWHPPQVSNISRFALISGVVYGHSNANPQIYQIWDTNQWHDDSPSDDPISYTCVMRMSYRHLATKNGIDRAGSGRFDKSYFEGYMSPGSNVYANVYFDYQGASGLQNVIINSVNNPAVLFSGSSAPSLGDSSLGNNPLGDGLVTEPNDQSLLPKFRAICDINPTDSYENEVEVYSTDTDSRWEILSLGTNLMKSPSQGVELRKSS